MQKSASAPGGKDRPLLDHAASFKHSINLPPSFTMRSKTAFGDEKLGTQGTEPGPDLSGKLDSVLRKSPSWSMTTRGTGIPKPPKRPGPGDYPVPSTLYGSHPTLSCAGRVPKRTEERAETAPKHNLNNPSPQHYNTVLSTGPAHKFGRADQGTTPKYTIRSKIVDPSEKETRPGCQTYNIGKASRNGIMTMPAWSMAPRGSGIPKAADTPGPGSYPIPGSIYGSHPALTCPGRVPRSTCKRFTYPEPDDRPY